MHVLQVVEHIIALKTSFLQKFTYIMHCCILNQNMGCLRVHSKYSLACHWLFYWPGMKEQDIMKSTLVTNMRARTLPSQNACRVKADGMGPSYRQRFPAAMLYSRLDHNGHNLCKTVCMDVRLFLFSFCVFSEHWSLGSLYTCIRWSRLMSQGPHRAGIRAILTVGSLS